MPGRSAAGSSLRIQTPCDQEGSPERNLAAHTAGLHLFLWLKSERAKRGQEVWGKSVLLATGCEAMSFLALALLGSDAPLWSSEVVHVGVL